MANYVPLGTTRRWPREGFDDQPPTTPATISSSGGEPAREGFVDTRGEIIVKAPVTGACRKCGFTGHLPYQCRNTIPLKSSTLAAKRVIELDVSSTSSESDYETPLTAKKELKKEKKAEKKRLKKLKKRLKKELKAKKEAKKSFKKKKKKKHHHRSRSSSSSSPSEDSDSSADESSSSSSSDDDHHHRSARKRKRTKAKRERSSSSRRESKMKRLRKE